MLHVVSPSGTDAERWLIRHRLTPYLWWGTVCKSHPSVPNSSDLSFFCLAALGLANYYQVVLHHSAIHAAARILPIGRYPIFVVVSPLKEC